jgi:hypothetical protein
MKERLTNLGASTTMEWKPEKDAPICPCFAEFNKLILFTYTGENDNHLRICTIVPLSMSKERKKNSFHFFQQINFYRTEIYWLMIHFFSTLIMLKYNIFMVWFILCFNFIIYLVLWIFYGSRVTSLVSLNNNLIA